jgi:hypothetical protein
LDLQGEGLFFNLFSGEDVHREINAFLETWKGKSQQIRDSFVRLKDHLAAKDSLLYTFKARPGVSYSLRLKHTLQQSRELFVIMDVIDDDPDSRWLSVCFYPDMITDPEERGNIIPLGLLGEDGYCFDYDEWDEEFLRYLEKRLDEAHERASKESKE